MAFDNIQYVGKVPENLEKLNQSQIRNGEDINILSAAIKWSYDKRIMVEMPIGLNQINLYSVDNAWGKTVCVGKSLDNINKIQEIPRRNRKYTYADLRVFPNFWGVLCIDEEEEIHQKERVKFPVIQLFNWECMPLVELRLPAHIASFDFDLLNGHLYTLDVHTDEFCRYDIDDLLLGL